MPMKKKTQNPSPQRNDRSSNGLGYHGDLQPYAQPLSAFFELAPLAPMSCSGWPRACIRSVHTRQRQASFRAAAARPRAHKRRGGSTAPSKTQTHSSASRPTASTGVGAVLPPAGSAIIALRGHRYRAGVPFCGELPLPAPLPSRQSGGERTPERVSNTSSRWLLLCVTIPVPSPDLPTLGPQPTVGRTRL